jgi:hypothetical protein
MVHQGPGRPWTNPASEITGIIQQPEILSLDHYVERAVEPGNLGIDWGFMDMFYWDISERD